MEISATIKATQHSVPSQDGQFIAALSSSQLEIRSTSSLRLFRTISISSRGPIIRWSPTLPGSEPSYRILIADEDNVRVWDLYDEKWTATINNGSGGMGKIVNAEFGRTKDEVICFSDFGSKATAWSLKSGRSVEVRDPKFSTTRTFGFRPITGLCAMLSRPGPQDVLTLHAPTSYAVLKMVTLQSIDAQGIRWSPDGRWLTVWDTPSIGYKVFIYTADGHLYRVYNGDCGDDAFGLGIKTLEWSPKSDYLAIGGHDRRVTLLSTRTFSPVMFLDHTATIQLATGSEVWEEQLSASAQRSYKTVTQPIALPTASTSQTDQTIKAGLSIIAFNADGSMVATRDDSAPTTVWLWDLTKLAASTVLIQHSPIKRLSWHPTILSVLLIQCSHEEPTIYLYDAVSSVPYPLLMPIKKSAGKFEAKWIPASMDKKPGLVFGDLQNFLLAWPDGQNPQSGEEKGADDLLDQSEDSLFDILSGRSPLKSGDSTEALVSDVMDETTEIMDDTFIEGRVWALSDFSLGPGHGDGIERDTPGIFNSSTKYRDMHFTICDLV